MSTSRNLFFTNAADHAVHVQRLYQCLIEEMKVFERTWDMAEHCYAGNPFLQDMHTALIYLDHEMKFRNSPEDPPIKGRAPLDPILVNIGRRYSDTQYKPSFPAAVPYESPIYVPKTDENRYTYLTDLEYPIAGPSCASITSEVNCSARETRQHLLKDKGRVAPIDETSNHPDVVTAGRYHSYKGKEREAQPDRALCRSGVAVKIEPTDPRILKNNNYKTAPEVDLRRPPPLDLAPARLSSMSRSTSHYHRTTAPTVQKTEYSIPYCESRAYQHSRNRTFDPPRSVSPGPYETHPTYWKRKLSEEAEDRYMRSHKRSRRN